MKSALQLAWISSFSVAALGAVGWLLEPGRHVVWMTTILLLPCLWGLIELRMTSADRDKPEVQRILAWHRTVVAWVGAMIAVRLAIQLGILAGLLDLDWEPFGRRLKGVLFGTGLAIWGNYLPKLISPWSADEEPFDWQRVHHFVGWLATFSGLTLVVVWLVAPIDTARPTAFWITIAFVTLALGSKLLSLMTSSQSSSQIERKSPP